MPDLFKDIYNEASLRVLAADIKQVYPAFQSEAFLKAILNQTWDTLELKARMRQISVNLGNYLPRDFREAIQILDKIVANYQGFFGIVFPDFIEVCGQDECNWDTAVSALERYTVYSSSEFAVRPFILRNEERMMPQMYAWSKHDNEHIRRLSSEGCRPRLPWGQALTNYKNNPAPILPILEQLKTDSSLYVRKSVANNLNDISKDHPDVVVQLAKEWYGKNKNTDWIIKHGCRTLLKKGNREVLSMFGYHADAAITIKDFALSTAMLSISEDITFSFTVQAKAATKVRLEYAIDYVKANGKRNQKIFQISETTLKDNEQKSYQKKHSFADLSTRRHYPGTHTITLIVNGTKQRAFDFELKPENTL